MLYELSFLLKLYTLRVLFDFDADPSFTRRIEGGTAAPRGGGRGQEGEESLKQSLSGALGGAWTGSRVSVTLRESLSGVSTPSLGSVHPNLLFL